MRYSKQRTMAGFIGATGGLPAEPVNTVAPSITGTATSGSTLTANPGTWTGRETPTLSYKWNRAGTPVDGATATTYVLGAEDVGSAMTVTVTGTNWADTVAATSAATATVT